MLFVIFILVFTAAFFVFSAFFNKFFFNKLYFKLLVYLDGIVYFAAQIFGNFFYINST
jgi:hypothetical protein